MKYYELTKKKKKNDPAADTCNSGDGSQKHDDERKKPDTAMSLRGSRAGKPIYSKRKQIGCLGWGMGVIDSKGAPGSFSGADRHILHHDSEDS